MTDRLRHRYVHHVLSSRNDRLGLEFRGLTTAWNLTQAGLVKIGKVGPPARPVAVIGSTTEDFALAVALDRMYEPATWMPAEWAQDSHLRWPVQLGYRDLLDAARPSGHPPIVMSISLSEQQLNEAVQASWPEPIRAWRGNGDPVSLDGDPPEVILADQLDLGRSQHLACGPRSRKRVAPHRGQGLLSPISAHQAHRDQPGAWGAGSLANSKNMRGRDEGIATTVDPSAMGCRPGSARDQREPQND